MDPRDRRDLACLGLTVLVYGLVVAPVVHAVTEHLGGQRVSSAARRWLTHEAPSERAQGADGHGHEHGPGGEHEGEGEGHRHLGGSVEHLQAAALVGKAVLSPLVQWVRLHAPVFRGPLRAPGEPARLTAMPQGP